MAHKASAGAAGLILMTLCAGQFLMMLDSSVMNVSIATVAKDVGTTVTGIQTAITLYTLVMAAFMITGGKIGQIIGRKRAFAIGCVIYGCGSLTTALAPNLTVLLIGWSCLEGLGAALILPAIVALVASNFDRAERPRAYGLVTAAAAIAVAVGPIVGGLFTTYLSWRYVFAGEVVLVVAILVLARRIEAGEPERKVQLDLVGTALSALGLGLIVFGILRSGTWGLVKARPDAPEWIGLSPVVWLMLGGAAVLALFLWWENRLVEREGEPLVDPAILRVSVLRAGLTSFFFQYFLQGGMFFAMPLFLSIALGLSAIETGVRLLPLSFTLIIAAAGIPKLLPRRLAAAGRPPRLPRHVRRAGGDGRRARGRGGAGDRHLAADPGRARDRCARLAAWQRHRLLGPGRAERRGRRPAEHDHQSRHLGRHGADRRDRHRRPQLLLPDRGRGKPGRAGDGEGEGIDRALRRHPLPLR